MNTIPTQSENPKGLHQRFVIQKIVPATQLYIDNLKTQHEILIPNNPVSPRRFIAHKFMAVPVDDNAEYFVMRLDNGGSDKEHIKACRIGVHAYADAIEHHLPELAKDIKERYPLPSQNTKPDVGVREETTEEILKCHVEKNLRGYSYDNIMSRLHRKHFNQGKINSATLLHYS